MIQNLRFFVLASISILSLSGCGSGVSSGVTTTNTPVHYVALSWTASVTPNVDGYNIYRGDQTGGPYALVGTVAGTSLTYTDLAVTAGDTYFYVGTAFLNGNESGYSTETSATIPTHF